MKVFKIIISSLKRTFSFLLRLQWKLTLSYTLVTVVVVTILMFTTIFVSGLMTFNQPQVTLFIAESMSSSATRLAPALVQSPVNKTDIHNWVTSAHKANNIIFDNSDEDPEQVSMSFSTVVSGDSVLAVLDTQGNVIDSSRPEILPIGSPVSSQLAPGAQTLIERVQNGENIAARLLQHLGYQQTVVAPVRAEDRRLVGMVILVYHGPSWPDMLWISLTSTVPAVLVISFVAAVIGSLFGAATARGLTKRLKAATRATAAWGAGDFSVRINDNNADEIGQLARDLNGMANRLQELMNTRQELAALEERNRIARDLHDSAKQQVFATSMNLAAARALWERNPSEAQKRVEIAADLSRQSQQELTNLIQTLRPSQFNHHGFIRALYEMVHSWESQYNIPVTYLSGGEEPLLPSEVEQALFRVAQEAFSNIARHSAASQAELALTHTEQAIIMEIKDNGHGFDMQQTVSGLGLRSMQERITAIGGTLSITSHPTGTCITVRVPIRGEHSHE